jgi:2-iminobutanoate/2-iminopropanoate deaminase
MPVPHTSADGLIHVSGVRARPSARSHEVAVQTRDVLDQLAGRLSQAGSGLDHAVSIHVHLCRAADFAAMNAAYAPAFGMAVPPARTTVVVRAFEEADSLVEMSAVAVPAGHPREALRPADWKPSVNPYSYAIRAGDAVLLAGLVSRSGRSNEIVPGDLAVQAGVIFDNASQLLATAGLSLADVVSARVFLTRPDDLPALNGVYRERMPTPRPARTTVLAGLMHETYRVEMTFVAIAGKGVVLPPGMPAEPDAIQVPAIRAGRRVFLSGMRGDDVHASVENQARSAVGRLASCLHAAGLDW